MKIARFTEGGRTRLGIVDTDTDEIIDVGSADDSLPTDLGQLLQHGALVEAARTAHTAKRIAISAVKLEAPIVQPPTFLAVGLNYTEHISETSANKPNVPVIFNKQVTCIAGPGDGIEIPTVAPDWVDYEGELGIVIGRRCRNVAVDDAASVVAGYLIVNDVSVRDWQKASPTMTMGKSWDTHGPIGPWLVSADEVGDPHDLSIRTLVDGEVRQDSTTKLMITNCWEIIAHLSTAFTLLPGTIIATGTPAGVGFAMKPPRCLQAGSVVRIEIDKLGVLENPVIAQA